MAFVATRGGNGPDQASRSGRPVTGADLHSLVVDPADALHLYVGGHQAVSESTDGGRTWREVASLQDADAMGWAFLDGSRWMSGHPGLRRSDDGGTFRQANQGLPDTDLHALGGLRRTLYAAGPRAGVIVSTDAGASWQQASGDGRSFFGRIIVDPNNTDHLLAADASRGAVESPDAGRTWRPLGAPGPATWVTLVGGDPRQLVASGGGDAARSSDGGSTWEPLRLPDNSAIVEASPVDGQVLYAAALDGGSVRVWVSRDGGTAWLDP